MVVRQVLIAEKAAIDNCAVVQPIDAPWPFAVGDPSAAGGACAAVEMRRVQHNTASGLVPNLAAEDIAQSIVYAVDGRVEFGRLVVDEVGLHQDAEANEHALSHGA